MRKRTVLATFLFVSLATRAVCQGQSPQILTRDSLPAHKFSISTTWLSFLNFGYEKTNTQHYELRFRYQLDTKTRIGIKVATWKLYAPMGIPLWDSNFLKDSEFYPGRLRESGVGITYQRMLWKGLFATLEILPLLKTYINQHRRQIGNGFKLYTSYHLGYHIHLFKNRIYLEPQIHCQYWPIDTNTPQSFGEKEGKWNNYFLFEPNLYIGINF